MIVYELSRAETNNIDHILAWAGAAGELLVFTFLIRSKTFRKLPFFTIYIAWTIISDLALIYLQNSINPTNYLHWYLAETSIDSALQFAFLVELAWSVLKPVKSSLPRHTLLVLIGSIAVLGAVIWPFAGQSSPKSFIQEDSIIYHTQQTFAILRVVCFLLLASLSQLLSIGWRDRELQVATGIGTFSIVSLIVSVLHTHPSSVSTYHYLDWATSVSYLGSLSYWVYCFSTSEQERREFSPQMQHFLLQMGGGARSSRVALTNLTRDRSQEKD